MKELKMVKLLNYGMPTQIVQAWNGEELDPDIFGGEYSELREITTIDKHGKETRYMPCMGCRVPVAVDYNNINICSDCL